MLLFYNKRMFPARIELASSRVLGGRDNHYTKETQDGTTVSTCFYFKFFNL